jgi:hypothetical protein
MWASVSIRGERVRWVLTAPRLHLIFRNADGSPTAYTWYFFAVATFMIASGIWTLISPSSYARFWMMGRRGHGFQPHPVVARVLGAVGILAALVAVAWMAMLAEPGRLY